MSLVLNLLCLLIFFVFKQIIVFSVKDVMKLFLIIS